MTTNELDELLQFIKDTALHAGRYIIMPAFTTGNINVSYKSNTDLLTDIDKQCELFIVNEIQKRYPGHSIVAEEGSGSENNSDYVWFIDPIDGTNNFAHGIPHFAVSIALYSKKGEAIAACVYDPCVNEVFYAAKDKGAWCNGKRITVSDMEHLDRSMVFTGFPYEKNNATYNNVDQAALIIPQVQAFRRFGAASLDLCSVAVGRCEAYWEPFLKPWDMAAGMLILREAGGTVSDYRGNPTGPFTRECVASNGSVHNQILALLQRSTAEYPNDR